MTLNALYRGHTESNERDSRLHVPGGDAVLPGRRPQEQRRGDLPQEGPLRDDGRLVCRRAAVIPLESRLPPQVASCGSFSGSGSGGRGGAVHVFAIDECTSALDDIVIPATGLASGTSSLLSSASCRRDAVQDDDPGDLPAAAQAVAQPLSRAGGEAEGHRPLPLPQGVRLDCRPGHTLGTSTHQPEPIILNLSNLG